MGQTRQDILKRLWQGHDPFAGFPEHLYEVDVQGWGEGHRYLTESVASLKPRIVVEVGVWKGASVIRMASKMKELDLDSVIIAVDTWLGSWDHWLNPQWFSHLSFEHGRSSMQSKFMNNVIAKGLVDYVVPLPLDSLNAAYVLRHHKIQPDVVHLDGGHDYASVSSDLNAWWPQIRPGGVLIGDDYYLSEGWPEVKRAFDDFFGAIKLTPFDMAPPKCRIWKPA